MLYVQTEIKEFSGKLRFFMKKLQAIFDNVFYLIDLNYQV